MGKRTFRFVYILLGWLFAFSVTAEDFGTSIPMQEKGADTFYVQTEIEGLGTVDFMVDTGSGHATINEATLATLMQQQNASYVKNLEGILADGSRIVVPVYSIKQMSIGGQCDLKNIEVAVFPGKTRQILGLSALRQASPFIFSIDPPALKLSNCSTQTMETTPNRNMTAEPLDAAILDATASPS